MLGRNEQTDWKWVNRNSIIAKHNGGRLREGYYKNDI
jgi:hypothetical protein